jgi:type II secretory pathway component PulK
MSRSLRILRTRAGSLLVVTLWVVTILVVLVLAITRILSLEVRLTKYRLAREQAKAFARSGVVLAMERLERDVEPDGQYDWLEDDWAAEVWQVPGTDPNASVEIVIVDEERKLNVNVNTATAEQLALLIGSSDVANALVDYRDSDSDGEWEAVVEEQGYYPKNAPLVASEELREIPGQTTDTLEAFDAFTRVVPEDPGTTVNVNTAPREVLVAVGLPETAEEILQFRDQRHYLTALTPDVKAESDAVLVPFADSPEFLKALETVPPTLQVHSDTFRIAATGMLASPKVRHRIEAVVRREGQNVQIIAWRES